MSMTKAEAGTLVATAARFDAVSQALDARLRRLMSELDVLHNQQLQRTIDIRQEEGGYDPLTDLRKVQSRDIGYRLNAADAITGLPNPRGISEQP